MKMTTETMNRAERLRATDSFLAEAEQRASLLGDRMRAKANRGGDIAWLLGKAGSLVDDRYSVPLLDHCVRFTRNSKRLALLSEPYLTAVDEEGIMETCRFCLRLGLKFEINPEWCCWNPPHTTAILYWRAGERHPIRGRIN